MEWFFRWGVRLGLTYVVSLLTFLAVMNIIRFSGGDRAKKPC